MSTPVRGYFFALTRLLARLRGEPVRKAEFARWEIYSVGWFVFGFACIVAARALVPFIRPVALKLLVLLLLPAAVWMALLLFYFVNWTIAAALRGSGVYSACTNNPLQHVIIVAVLSLCALALARDHNIFFCSLGIFWLALVILELCAQIVLCFLSDE